jgi:hypothetical protein
MLRVIAVNVYGFLFVIEGRVQYCLIAGDYGPFRKRDIGIAGSDRM